MKLFRPLLGVFLLILASSPTWAGDLDRDYEYARGLLRLGMPELAKQCADNMIKGKSIFGGRATRDSTQRASGEYLLIEILKWKANQANRLGQEDKYKQFIKEYTSKLKRFQKKHRNHPSALAASLDLILTKRSQAHNELIKARVEPDETKKKGRIREGVKLYDMAVKEFQALIKRYDKAIDKRVKDKLRDMLAKSNAKHDFDKPEYYDADMALRQNPQFWQLRFRRGNAEYLLGQTCLLYARWMERLEEDMKALNLHHKTKGILDQAQKSFTHIDDEFVDIPVLRGRSGVARGEVYLRQAKLTGDKKKYLALARNLYDGFCLFRFPRVPKGVEEDPSMQRLKEEITKEVVMGAFEGLCKTFIRLKQYKNAIYVIDKRMLRTDDNPKGKYSYSEVLGMNAGRLALMAKTEALSVKQPPEPHKAMEEVLRIVEWAKRNEKPLKGRNYGMIALRSAIRLCDIREQMGAVRFGPEVSLLMAHGFYETGNYKWAIYSYKDVLSSREVRDEETLAGALKGLGHCYFNTKRYEEAAMAYYGVFERFPSRREGIKLAKQALGILTKQFGKDDEAVADLKQMITNRIGGSSTFYASAYDKEAKADQFAEEGKKSDAVRLLQQAIGDYKKVEPIDKSTGGESRYFATSQAKVGSCMYQIYKLNGDQTMRDQAKSWLENQVIAKFRGRNSRAWSAGLFFLARIYRDMDQPKKVLEILEPFDNKLQKTAYAGAAKSMVIGAAVAMGNYKIADDEFAKLKANPSTTPAQLVSSAARLTYTYNQFVDREREKMKNAFRAWTFIFSRSNTVNLVGSKKLSLAMVQTTKTGTPRFLNAEQRAAKYAKIVYDYYKTRGAGFNRLYALGETMYRGKRYKWALDSFVAAEKIGTPKSFGKDMANRYMFYVKRYQADCLRELGKHSEALKIYEELAKDKSMQRNIYGMYRVLEGRAKAAYGKAQRAGTPANMADALKAYHEFRVMLRGLDDRFYANLKEYHEPSKMTRYWEVTLRTFKLLHLTNRSKEAYKRMQALIKQKANFGNERLKGEFRKFYQMLQNMPGVGK